MEANELRIGNLVTDEFYETFRKTITVESINDKGINLSIENSDDFPEMQDHWIEPHYEFDELRGIELTPEWLTLLGFDAYTYASELSGMITEYTFNNLSIVDFESSGKNFVLSNAFNFNVRPKVKYVHHLQNLVHAILGRELELNK